VRGFPLRVACMNNMISASALAYIGDGVYELLLRRRLVASGIGDTGRLTAEGQKYACAPFQAAAADRLMPQLTTEEVEIFKRGRNANSTSRPKNATISEYRRATGLEALFGHLHLTQQTQRLEELFEMMFEV